MQLPAHERDAARDAVALGAADQVRLGHGWAQVVHAQIQRGEGLQRFERRTHRQATGRIGQDAQTTWVDELAFGIARPGAARGQQEAGVALARIGHLHAGCHGIGNAGDECVNPGVAAVAGKNAHGGTVLRSGNKEARVYRTQGKREARPSARTSRWRVPALPHARRRRIMTRDRFFLS
jgi:hypothetical protein